MSNLFTHVHLSAQGQTERHTRPGMNLNRSETGLRQEETVITVWAADRDVSRTCRCLGLPSALNYIHILAEKTVIYIALFKKSSLLKDAIPTKRAESCIN